MNNESKSSLMDKLTGKFSVTLLIIAVVILGGLNFFVSYQTSKEKKIYVENIVKNALKSTQYNSLMEIVSVKYDSSYNPSYNYRFKNHTLV